MVNNKIIKKILVSLLCAAIGYVVISEIQLIGINLMGAIGSAVLGLAPILLDWFNKYNARINSTRDLAIQRVEELNDKIETRFDYLNTRLNNLAEETELNKVRAEAYSARGEAQQALSIVNMALDQSAVAQKRINDLLSSGVIFKLCEITTKLELRQSIIENMVNKNIAIVKYQDVSNDINDKNI